MNRWRWNPFLRFPRMALLLSAIAFLPLLARLPNFHIRSESKVLLEGDQRNLASYEKVKEILAETEVLIVSVEMPQVFSTAGLDALRRVSDAFLAQPGVVDVKSLTHAAKPIRQGLGFLMVPFVPEGPLTDIELRELRDFSLAHPLVRNVMVAEDSRHTIIMVTYDQKWRQGSQGRNWRQELERILSPFSAEGLRFNLLSMPLVEEEIASTLRADLRIMLPAGTILVLLVLAGTFRSWKVVLLVLLNLLLALLVMPGVIELTGSALTVFSAVLLPLTAAVHLTLLAHIYTSIQRHYRHGLVGMPAVIAMLDEVFKSCAFAFITTVVGMLSLLLSNVKPVRDFGFLGIFLLAFVFVATFGPGLSLLEIATRNRWLGGGPQLNFPVPPSNLSLNQHWSTRLTNWIMSHRKTIGLSTVLLVGLAAVGLGRVRTDIRAVEFLQGQSPARRTMEELDKIYGGVNVVQIELDSGNANGANRREFLQYVDRLHRYAETRPEITAVYSYAQLLSMINQVWNGGAAAELKLPDNPVLAELFAVALRSGDFPFVSALADPSLRVAYLVLRTRDMPAGRYLNLIAEIVSYAERTKPIGVRVSAAKGIHSILEADRAIVRSQISTAGSTVLVIGFVLALLWRSLWLALCSLITNVVPVALVISLAGFVAVPLNSITVMIAAITFGIAVDDSVHFITHWREERKSGAAPALAIPRTLALKGRAIIATSVVLIAIFSVLILSSFPPLVNFGWLSAAAFAAALIAVLLLLPALLR